MNDFDQGGGMIFVTFPSAASTKKMQDDIPEHEFIPAHELNLKRDELKPVMFAGTNKPV